MAETQPEKPTHLLRVVFAVDGADGTHDKTFGWTPKLPVLKETADGKMWVPDPAGDEFVEKNPATLEIHFGHGGKTIIPRTRVLFYETKTVARIKAETEAFKARVADADVRLSERDAERQRFQHARIAET